MALGPGMGCATPHYEVRVAYTRQRYKRVFVACIRRSPVSSSQGRSHREAGMRRARFIALTSADAFAMLRGTSGILSRVTDVAPKHSIVNALTREYERASHSRPQRPRPGLNTGERRSHRHAWPSAGEGSNR